MEGSDAKARGWLEKQQAVAAKSVDDKQRKDKREPNVL